MAAPTARHEYTSEWLYEWRDRGRSRRLAFVTSQETPPKCCANKVLVVMNHQAHIFDSMISMGTRGGRQATVATTATERDIYSQKHELEKS